MENTLCGATVYGGVLEFTSPSLDSAYLPQWMMDHLQVQDGAEIAFKHVDLPKGQFVQLQPVSSSWLVSCGCCCCVVVVVFCCSSCCFHIICCCCCVIVALVVGFHIICLFACLGHSL